MQNAAELKTKSGAVRIVDSSNFKSQPPRCNWLPLSGGLRKLIGIQMRIRMMAVYISGKARPQTVVDTGKTRARKMVWISRGRPSDSPENVTPLHRRNTGDQRLGVCEMFGKVNRCQDLSFRSGWAHTLPKAVMATAHRHKATYDCDPEKR